MQEQILEQIKFVNDEMATMKKAITAKQQLGDTLTTFEIRRLVSQRNLLEQLHFAQMRHHATCLQYYASIFQKVQEGVSVEDLFVESMMLGGVIKEQKELKDFIDYRKSGKPLQADP